MWLLYGKDRSGICRAIFLYFILILIKINQDGVSPLVKARGTRRFFLLWQIPVKATMNRVKTI